MHKFILAIALAACSLIASHHKTVEHDQLEVGKIYHVKLEELRIYTMGPFGWVHVSAYGFHLLRVLEKGRDGSKLWYEVRRIEPATIGTSRDRTGRIVASDLKKGTVYVDYE